MWQANARFAFRLLGVFGLVPGVDRRSTTIPPLLNPRQFRSSWSGKMAWESFTPVPGARPGRERNEDLCRSSER